MKSDNQNKKSVSWKSLHGFLKIFYSIFKYHFYNNILKVRFCLAANYIKIMWDLVQFKNKIIYHLSLAFLRYFGVECLRNKAVYF